MGRGARVQLGRVVGKAYVEAIGGDAEPGGEMPAPVRAVGGAYDVGGAVAVVMSHAVHSDDAQRGIFPWGHGSSLGKGIKSKTMTSCPMPNTTFPSAAMAMQSRACGNGQVAWQHAVATSHTRAV